MSTHTHIVARHVSTCTHIPILLDLHECIHIHSSLLDMYSGVTRLFRLGGLRGGQRVELGGQAVVTLTKRSATFGWRVAYNDFVAKYTS